MSRWARIILTLSAVATNVERQYRVVSLIPRTKSPSDGFRAHLALRFQAVPPAVPFLVTTGQVPEADAKLLLAWAKMARAADIQAEQNVLTSVDVTCMKEAPDLFDVEYTVRSALRPVVDPSPPRSGAQRRPNAFRALLAKCGVPV
jgi:hypothetical protein